MLETLQREGSALGAQAISLRCGLHITTVLYHLRRLEKDVRVGRVGRLWSCGLEGPEEGPRAGPVGDRALRILREAGPLDHSELAARLGVSRPSVSGIVARLAAKGLVEVQRASRRKLVSPK